MAFTHRCKNCGRLETGDHAGINAIPHACRVCGSGVIWNGGRRSFDSGNWEVLAEATAERLAELGLAPEDVSPHKPPSVEESDRQDYERARANLAVLQEQESDWITNKDKYLREWRTLDDQARKLQKMMDRAGESGDIVSLEKYVNELDRTRQAMKDLQSREAGARHQAHKYAVASGLAAHETRLAGRSVASQSQSVFVSASDSAGSSNRT